MGRVIQGPWKGSVVVPEQVEVEALETERPYEQCVLQQEYAFKAGKYYEIFMVGGDFKRCYTQRCEREAAERQINMRGGVFEDDPMMFP